MPQSSCLAKFLVLLMKYCLNVSFGRGIFRWTNLDVKWSIDSLQCKVTDYLNNTGIPLVYLDSVL